MMAVRIHAYGDASVLRYEDAPIPEIGSDEVLVKVWAAAVNPIDWKIRRGLLKGALNHCLPLTLGWDVSGTIAHKGLLVSRFQVGDAVFSRPDIARDGGYAEYVAVRTDEVAWAPQKIALERAAGIPLAALTAWMCLFEKAKLRSGQSVLIHAASGGVGTFAIQLAKIAGAYVLGTTSAANIDLVKSLGADEVIDYRSEDFSTKVKDIDVVLDAVGGDVQRKSWGVLRKGGVLVSIVEPPPETVAQQRGMLGQYAFVAPNGARLEELAGLVDAGKLKVIVEREFRLSEAAAAHALSEAGHVRGKIILRIA
jgi:NADPH:quinone reductase-like Zn-dependent oxidoreductase